MTRGHSCRTGNHLDPCNACYVICRCRCYGCGFDRSEYDRRRAKLKAYGTPPMVDAEPVRTHIRRLMAPPHYGSNRGMGWKRIAAAAGLHHSTVSRVLYGQAGRPPPRQVRRQTADKLLAVRLDLADGSSIPSGPTCRKLAEMVAGGFTRAELGRYLTGDVRTRDLQAARGRYVTVATARHVDDLYRRWTAGKIVPRGRWSRWQHGPPPVTPATPEPEGVRCEGCGAPPMGGGRWCLPCFRQSRKAAA